MPDIEMCTFCIIIIHVRKRNSLKIKQRSKKKERKLYTGGARKLTRYVKRKYFLKEIY